MARSRKRHRQEEIKFPDRNAQKRGGKRKAGKGKRLGRPTRGERSSERHERRPAVNEDVPIYVVLRVTKQVGALRKRKMYSALREALITVLLHEDCHVVHLSIQNTHLNLLVEAKDRMALARGMQAFQISAAKRLNAEAPRVDGKRRRGNVFTDRYHAVAITNRRRARHALAYVLNNWRRHREDRAGFARKWNVDPYSSGDSFLGWRELEGKVFLWRTPDTYRPLPVRHAESWLLREGWKLYGLISTHEVPGPKPV
jgi:REP element-mobilizing transposase RayT